MKNKTTDPIEYIMMVWNIQANNRSEIVQLFETHKQSDTLDLALRNYSQHPDDTDFDPQLEAWPSPLAA